MNVTDSHNPLDSRHSCSSPCLAPSWGRRRVSLRRTGGSLDGAARCAFTLVEMMVALALGLLIIGITVTIFAQTSKVSRLAHAKIEAAGNARAAMEFLDADITGAYISGTYDGLFVGVRDSEGEDDVKLNNNASGASWPDTDADEGEDTWCGDDPWDFTYDDSGGPNNYQGLGLPDYRYRSGLELTSTSMYAYDSAGRYSPFTHVLYYLTQDRQVGGDYTAGRLVRYTWEDTAGPLSVFPNSDAIPPRLNRDGDLRHVPAYDPDVTSQESDTDVDDRIERSVVAYGVVNFRLQFYGDHDGTDDTWGDTWDSRTGKDQDGRRPEVVHVQIDVIDSNDVLAGDDAEPYRLSRLIEVGTTAP